ncbi:hypothetical protein HYV88_01595 [Candidatus Woesearchaeota archaeon]|nr:hypothetical protein [Candidatus Woesearchaeota archaeon]
MGYDQNIPEVNWSKLDNIACASVYCSKVLRKRIRLWSRVNYWFTKEFMDFVGKRLQSEQGEYERLKSVFDRRDIDYLDERLRQF